MKDKRALTASVLFCALSLTIGACSEIPQPLPEVGTLDEYVANPVVTPSQATPYNMYSQHDVVGDCTDKGYVSTIWGSCLTSHLSTTAGVGFVAY